MSYKVRFVNPQEHYRRLKLEIDETFEDVLSRGDLIYRDDLKEFEEHLADFVGTEYAVGLNSGYDALHVSLRAAGIGPGDEVITVAHTFVATVSAIVNVGATPVLVDVGKDFNMDAESCERAITPQTKAVLPVHLNGRMADMGRLMEIAEAHNLIVITDAAQSLGASYDGKKAGSWGDAACFSFYPFKILGAFGDAGAITTNDPEIARIATLLRYNGEDRETREYVYHGRTCLLDNLQAAFLDLKLKYLPQWLVWRSHLAEMYCEGLTDLPQVDLPHFEGDAYEDVYQNYVICADRRDDLVAYLEERGVETLVQWDKPMYAHEGLKLGEYHLPETERICKRVMSLPMYAELEEWQVEYVVECVRDFYG
jgi:dTDP-4-amino-4,6-dideoxygalactose transaminase